MKMVMNEKIAYFSIVVFWAIMNVSGCSTLDEPYIGIDSDSSASETFTLTMQSSKMLPKKVMTKASDPKDDAEKEIRQLYLFFFDSEGQYLSTYQNRFIGFQKPGEGQSTVKIDRSAINELMSDKTDKNVTVYAVANVEPETFSDTDGNDMPDDFEGSTDGKSPMAQLQEYVYKPQNVTLGFPDRYGMPMIGSRTIDFSDNDVNNAIIQMKALMARIDISITLDSDEESNNLPALSLVEWSVVNAPTKISFSPLGDGEQTSLTGENGSEKDVLTEEETEVPYNGQTIFNRNGQISFSFYMFENIQNEDRNNPEWTDLEGNYPAGTTEDEYQRYKPYLANDDAAAVKLHAYYSTYNDDGTGSATYDVTYTLYLGANHTDDFKVKRNHQYKNDITIKGLTQVGNNPEHITFDARVNIVEDNPFYISILRERNHDAHFCVTPMDVYLFDGGTMTVSLGDDADIDGKPWIRMEKVNAGTMESGNPQSDDHLGHPGAEWHAGTGKRKYFTKSLLNTLDFQYKKTVTLSHRDRVYFYLDENLELEDREAVVNLTYKNGNQEKAQTLTLVQTHLLPVDVYDRKPDDWNDDRDGEWKPTWQKRIYMEAYEEYLDHYDPLDEYSIDHIYDGLPWAESGSTLASSAVPNLRITGDDRELDGATDNYYSGWGYTSYMVQEEGNPNMTLDTKPVSAAEYCYNKNVRQDDNSIPWDARDIFIVGWTIYEDGSKWFLPGIREMEDALTQYYSNYNEFQTNFYWSSSAAKRRWQIGDITAGPHQEKSRARATKVLSDGKYAESAYDEDNYTDENGTGGRALRTQELRIRAFRTDLEPVE